MTTDSRSAPPWIAFAPAIFVVLWSTGFIGMRLGAPFAEPFTFMLARMTVVVTIFAVIAIATRAPWPKTPREFVHIALAGLLVHAVYLCGSLFAIKRALPLGFVALIAGLQPVLTSLFAHFLLGERLNIRQWGGMALGLFGVGIVIGSKYGFGDVNAPGLASAGVALLGITFGTLYQKRFCSHMDMRTGGIIQYTATGAALAILAVSFETMKIEWTGQFVFALLWLSVVLSIGAISLLFVMIRRGAASKVASLFFLTPSVTAIMAWLLFGEALPVWAVAGLLITACGVAVVMRPARGARE